MIKFILFCVTICVALLFGLHFFPETVTFTEFHVEPVKDLGKGFAPNELLNNVERLFEGEIKGPEGFAVLNGELYTTLHGGFVAKVYEDQIIPVVKFGQQCNDWWEESKCGRPLGIEAVGNDHLVVADSYYGIYKYNVHNRKINKLVDVDTLVDGRKIKLFNSVDVAKDGTIYYSHSSSDFSLENGVLIFLSDASGRLMMYDPQTNTNTVLMKGLYFANGIVLSPDEDFLLVSETGHSRILKYHLKGPKKFTSEIFIDGLPGVPDNLQAIGEDRVFVSLFSDRSKSFPAPFQIITGFPMLRKFLVNFICFFQLTLSKIDRLYPNDFTKKAIHYIGHIESLAWAFPSNTTLLELNWKGDVVRSYHGSDGSFSQLSDVMVHEGYLYMGSPINEYLGRIPLTKLGEKIPVRLPEVATHKTQTPPSHATNASPQQKAKKAGQTQKTVPPPSKPANQALPSPSKSAPQKIPSSPPSTPKPGPRVTNPTPTGSPQPKKAATPSATSPPPPLKEQTGRQQAQNQRV